MFKTYYYNLNHLLKLSYILFIFHIILILNLITVLPRKEGHTGISDDDDFHDGAIPACRYEARYTFHEIFLNFLTNYHSNMSDTYSFTFPV